MSSQEGSAPSSVRPRQQEIKPWKVITASVVGNALEWYDIAIYSLFATYLGHAFFPSDNPTVETLLTLGTFALSFFIRPVGALVLGAYADRVGRKPAMTLTIMLMFVGTLMIVVMPTAAVIGIAAPILIMVARLIQGFAAGGEFGSATALMMEHLPERRGFAASFQFSSQAVSTLTAAGLGALLTTVLSTDQLNSWGFRIPFIVGLLVGPVGLYIRRHIPESPEFIASQEARGNGEGAAAVRTRESAVTPIVEMFKHFKLPMLLAMMALAASTCVNYFMTYVPTFAVNTLHLPSNSGFIATMVGSLVLIAVTPYSGFISDRVGRVRIMLPTALVLLASAWLLFLWVVSSPTLLVLIAVIVFLAVIKGMYYGPLSSVMGDVFATGVRGTGMAFSYNLGVAIFGGLTPFMAATFTEWTGDPKATAYWVMVAAGASVIALIVISKRLRIT